MAKLDPRRLAKVLTTVAYYESSEYGLYWDEDGSMPWKEFYWALQKIEGLSYIRQSHLKELMLIGETIPFKLEGNRLYLIWERPKYSPTVEPPPHLYHVVSLSALDAISKNGLNPPPHRSYLPLWAIENLALKFSKPSSDERLIVTVDTERAIEEGVVFLKAGTSMFLTRFSIPSRALHIPPVKQKALEQIHEKKERVKKKRAKKTKLSGHSTAPTPGSFTLDVTHFQKAIGIENDEGGGHGKRKERKKGPDWKREARKIRKTKRTI